MTFTQHVTLHKPTKCRHHIASQTQHTPMDTQNCGTKERFRS